MAKPIIIKGGTLITVDEHFRVLDADLIIRDGRIHRIRERSGASNDTETSESPVDSYDVIDASGCAVLPGFIQTHIHLCQTLIRGFADDLKLLDWLRRRVWPMEAAHSAASLAASARLGVAEMIRGGTTTALTMETVKDTEAVFRAVEPTGFRAIIGKCLMDKGEGVPRRMIEDPEEALEESLALLKAWHGKADGRIRYAFTPRFAVSCSRKLLESIAALADEHGVIIHTHASESREEVELVRKETGLENIEYLDQLGLTGPRTVLAHCVWAMDGEMAILEKTRTSVAHCPSSNLKLGSGIAPVSEMVTRGIRVTLGADGAPCNNRLDMLTEMRTAALLQKVRRGPESIPARLALRLATIEAARALGLEGEVGSIEEGKRADLFVLNLDRLHLTPRPDLVSTIVYAAERADIETVLIDGRVVLRDGQLSNLDEAEICATAMDESARLAERAGIEAGKQ